VLGTAFAVDISPHAVALAQDNIAHLGMAPSRVNVIQADILAADFVPRLKAATHNTPIHIITSNPPYICADEYAELPRSVREYEDRGALLAGPVPGVADGVAFYAHIARLAPQILTPLPELHASVPRIAVEIGVEQGAAVSSLLPGSTQVVKDQYGLDRMVVSML
jgi:methylase of polypeptide subunit release factors